MIIPLTNAFGARLVSNHPKRKGGARISLYRQDFHKNGYYPVYRIVFEDKIKTYYNKTLKQIIGILTRRGY